MAKTVGLASDIDGTLLRGLRGGISAEDRFAIERFRAAGGVFGVDTGRNRLGLLHAMSTAPGLELDFAILCSGAVVLDGKGEVLWERRISPEVVRAVRGELVFPQMGTCLVVGNGYWTTSRLMGLGSVTGMFAYARSVERIDEPLYGLSFQTPAVRPAARLAARINSKYGEVVCAYQNRNSVDVVPAGCSKATGLGVVRRTLGTEVVAAIGDSYNDVSMLEAADVGYTFRDSPEPVRRASTHLVGSVAEALANLLS